MLHFEAHYNVYENKEGDRRRFLQPDLSRNDRQTTAVKH